MAGRYVPFAAKTGDPPLPDQLPWVYEAAHASLHGRDSLPVHRPTWNLENEHDSSRPL